MVKVTYSATPEVKQAATEKMIKLQQAKTKIDKANKQLLEAVKDGNMDAVKKALENGADINYKDPETNETPIKIALSYENFAKANRIITYLAENPCIDIEDDVKETIKSKIINGDVRWGVVQQKVNAAKKTQPTVSEQINKEIEKTSNTLHGIQVGYHDADEGYDLQVFPVCLHGKYVGELSDEKIEKILKDCNLTNKKTITWEQAQNLANKKSAEK